MLAKHTKWLVVPVSLFVLTAAHGAPSISKPSIHVIDCALSPSSESHVPFVPELTVHTGPTGSHLASLAGQYLQPPASLTNSATPAAGARSLPAVPGAVLMVMVGFACVSLVRDRKVWLATLAGLLWAGQAGMQALPQLALRLSNRTHTKQGLAAGLTDLRRVEETSRLRSDVEGTQYIGLLHHLAGIPDAAVSSLHEQEFTRGEDKSRASGLAIIEFSSSLRTANNGSASSAEQLTYFARSLAFEILPRGPPNPA
jgi:hypothetical protein